MERQVPARGCLGIRVDPADEAVAVASVRADVEVTRLLAQTSTPLSGCSRSSTTIPASTSSVGNEATTTVCRKVAAPGGTTSC